MMKKLLALILALLIVCSMAGCGEVAGDIAGNVAEAAKKELEKQVKQTFDTYKMEILDMKTALGKLGGDSGDIQFFCAVLVQSDSDAIPQSIADTLSKIFHDAGIQVQTGKNIENAYLQHRELAFKYETFDDGRTYYTVWCYTDKLPSLEDLKELKPSAAAEGVG